MGVSCLVTSGSRARGMQGGCPQKPWCEVVVSMCSVVASNVVIYSQGFTNTHDMQSWLLIHTSTQFWLHMYTYVQSV